MKKYIAALLISMFISTTIIADEVVIIVDPTTGEAKPVIIIK